MRYLILIVLIFTLSPYTFATSDFDEYCRSDREGGIRENVSFEQNGKDNTLNALWRYSSGSTSDPERSTKLYYVLESGTKKKRLSKVYAYDCRNQQSLLLINIVQDPDEYYFISSMNDGYVSLMGGVSGISMTVLKHIVIVDLSTHKRLFTLDNRQKKFPEFAPVTAFIPSVTAGYMYFAFTDDKNPHGASLLFRIDKKTQKITQL